MSGRISLFRLVLVCVVGIVGAWALYFWVGSGNRLAEFNPVRNFPHVNIVQRAVNHQIEAASRQALGNIVGHQVLRRWSELLLVAIDSKCPVEPWNKDRSVESCFPAFRSEIWRSTFRHHLDCCETIQMFSFRLPEVVEHYWDGNRAVKRNNWVDSYGYPRSVIEPLSLSGNLILYNHLSMLLARNVSIVSGSPERASRSSQHHPIKNYFPPWHLMVAAFTGLCCSWWGWRTLCAERRENAATFVFLSGLCVWVYSVYGFLQWSEKF
ncbi:MAG: hypothetical protein JWO71_2222 [Candidatus Acidoferrum typicum]|nr:hypothetical protein [Candidatus Acidoferrum typicum]